MVSITGSFGSDLIIYIITLITVILLPWTTKAHILGLSEQALLYLGYHQKGHVVALLVEEG